MRKRKVGCKWVFTTMIRADGTLERYKARQVAKGYTQTHGIDYHENFASMAKMNAIWIIVSLATNRDWHGDLEDEGYMEVPLGLKEKFEKGKVCRLKKALNNHLEPGLEDLQRQ